MQEVPQKKKKMLFTYKHMVQTEYNFFLNAVLFYRIILRKSINSTDFTETSVSLE